MIGKIVPEKVREIQKWQQELEFRADAKSISFSQLSLYNICPKGWYRTYVLKEAPYEASIHTAFGTAFHETLQTWLEVLYNRTKLEVEAIDLEAMLLDNLRRVYQKDREAMGRDFSTSKELQEFYEDGVAILRYIKNGRDQWFDPKHHLVGCEIPLYVELQDKFYFKGFIDILVYDEENDVWKVIDIKTSVAGWNAKKKADFLKTSQVVLYKKFLSEKFNIPLKTIEVQYFIVRRKISENAEFPALRKRVQTFAPGAGPIICKRAGQLVETFLQEAVTPEGTYQEKEYAAKASKTTCRWCIYRDNCTDAIK